MLYLQCNSPTYVGDGSVCGLDSDSDGFPDVGLDCDQPQCVQVTRWQMCIMYTSEFHCSTGSLSWHL